jgi:proteasome assembly chaperone 2
MQYFAATEGGAPENLAGRTLVMPCVGAGNVGQLAVDLLVATLALPRVGYAEEPHVLPCVGNAPYAHAAGGTLATPLELYAAADGPVVLQMRSPAAPGAFSLSRARAGRSGRSAE